MSEQNNRIKVLDCTIRDGGICNDWDFDIPTVRKVYEALSSSGVDYMEIGYQSKPGLFDPNEVGLWRFCEENALKEVVQGSTSKMKLCTMIDVGRIRPEDIPPQQILQSMSFELRLMHTKWMRRWYSPMMHSIKATKPSLM